MKLTAKRERADRLKANEQKWSPKLMEAGWTVLPSVILERQHDLKLDPIDVNILMQLARYWWYGDNPPHPSKQAIAACIGKDPSTVRRHIARMEAMGYIRREKRFHAKYGQDTNVYRFDGLIKHATPLAEEIIAERKRKREANQVKRQRRMPRLIVSNQKTKGK